MVEVRSVDKLPADKIVILTTGSQGEPMSALSRMAMAEHSKLAIMPGDTVIISATPILGNEKSVGRSLISFSKKGLMLSTNPTWGFIHRAMPSRKNSNYCSTSVSPNTSYPFTVSTGCCSSMQSWQRLPGYRRIISSLQKLGCQ